MEKNRVVVNQNKNIAYIRLNEPKSLNALSNTLKEQLLLKLEEIEKNKEIKLIILAGEGKSFCAGGDLRAMKDPYDPMEIKRGMDLSKNIVLKLRSMPKIILAAVHGYAAGAGMSLALAADLVFAEEDAKFVLSFKNVGLIPDLGLHYHLSRQVGEWKAKEWMWTGKTLTAKEAMQYGLVMEQVQKDQLSDRVTEFAQTLAEGPVDAYIMSKLMINQSAAMRIEDMMEQENNIQSILRGSTGHQEALENFLNRKKK
ncbi:enoyl-CoA hydratase/isomerase family protein [Oceanobacillus jeddahense]|uniref:enoyl-CoA hydratase/isomerase family protein n=1 Tax=Oceanobacillus jeddahense TaxID=1462527 RepID=UPI000595A5AE|nr:enoyl-CoA hydratase/isomerase family protein [Oceanobacillus jeddahense]